MKAISLIIALLCINFTFSQEVFKGKKVNTNSLNKEYKKSRKKIYGQLKPKDYSDFKLILAKQINLKIDEVKSIFINYEQAGSNCSLMSGGEIYLKEFHKNNVQISNRISKENNAIDFFIYTSDSFLKSYTEKNKNYKLDTGFFAKEIFTLKENCNAFFILKPNGKYLICYGTDSFSDALAFFEKK